MSASKREHPLSGRRWNRIIDEAMSFYREQVERQKDALMADGFPPFHEPITPMRQFQILSAAKAANDPMYWDDPSAQRTLARLAMRFGDPAPVLPVQDVYPGGSV